MSGDGLNCLWSRRPGVLHSEGVGAAAAQILGGWVAQQPRQQLTEDRPAARCRRHIAVSWPGDARHFRAAADTPFRFQLIGCHSRALFGTLAAPPPCRSIAATCRCLADGDLVELGQSTRERLGDVRLECD